MRHSEFMIIR